MVIDFVRENKAYLKCDQCNKEHAIIQMKLTDARPFPVIDHEATKAMMAAFFTLHAICKPVPDMQLILIPDQA